MFVFFPLIEKKRRKFKENKIKSISIKKWRERKNYNFVDLQNKKNKTNKPNLIFEGLFRMSSWLLKASALASPFFHLCYMKLFIHLTDRERKSPQLIFAHPQQNTCQVASRELWASCLAHVYLPSFSTPRLQLWLFSRCFNIWKKPHNLKYKYEIIINFNNVIFNSTILLYNKK